MNEKKVLITGNNKPRFNMLHAVRAMLAAAIAEPGLSERLERKYIGHHHQGRVGRSKAYGRTRHKQVKDNRRHARRAAKARR